MKPVFMPSAPISIASSGLRFRWVILFQVKSGWRVVSVEFRILAPDMQAKLCKFAHRDELALGRQAVRILEYRFLKPDLRAHARSSARRNSPPTRPCLRR